MRLDKYLTEVGIDSRKFAKILLAEGRVTVNQKEILDGSFHVKETEDEVAIDGEIQEYKPFRYYVLNKPKGYITAVKDRNHQTVMELLPVDTIVKGLNPVGRLDIDTEGLLLLTNDGELTHKLLSPKFECQKVYYVELEQEITPRMVKRLEEGVSIRVGKEQYRTKPAKVEVIHPQAIHLKITEGKFHQVKLMAEACENSVTYLKRIQFGKLVLGDLGIGNVVEVSREDIL